MLDTGLFSKSNSKVENSEASLRGEGPHREVHQWKEMGKHYLYLFSKLQFPFHEMLGQALARFVFLHPVGGFEPAISKVLCQGDGRGRGTQRAYSRKDLPSGKVSSHLSGGRW